MCVLQLSQFVACTHTHTHTLVESLAVLEGRARVGTFGAVIGVVVWGVVRDGPLSSLSGTQAIVN